MKERAIYLPSAELNLAFPRTWDKIMSIFWRFGSGLITQTTTSVPVPKVTQISSYVTNSDIESTLELHKTIKALLSSISSRANLQEVGIYTFCNFLPKSQLFLKERNYEFTEPRLYLTMITAHQTQFRSLATLSTNRRSCTSLQTSTWPNTAHKIGLQMTSWQLAFTPSMSNPSSSITFQAQFMKTQDSIKIISLTIFILEATPSWEKSTFLLRWVMLTSNNTSELRALSTRIQKLWNFTGTIKIMGSKF